ncbi:MAG: phosphoenolpyruvate synthase [Burkholderia sp.]|nr:phosphoenolpyruvate synthase [Burkholderia sp.]
MPKKVDFEKVQAYVIPFEQLRMSDIEIVGGKNASLGEMISQLDKVGVRVPSGFATTALAFRDFLKENNLTNCIEKHLRSLDINDIKALAEAGKNIRKWIIESPIQLRLEEEICKQFDALQKNFPKESSFAVRSSATAEDLPDASFAGQQESYLNVIGISEVLDRVKYVFASLYNDRAISYRVHKGFSHKEVALSAGIQRMVRSDIGSSGVMFTIDTESGFRDAVFITSSYGLGEAIVQGAVNPDEFYVFKTTLRQDKYPIIRRSIGSKLIKMEFTQLEESDRVKTVDVELDQRNSYSITDDNVIELAKYGVIIEQHYKCPMDIEWGKDGRDGKIFILQARPETVKSQVKGKIERSFNLKYRSKILAIGRAIGQKIGSGSVRVIQSPSEMECIQSGDVLVADMTDPNWEPVMKRAAAIVTNRGGRTCHAAIIARELGVPAVVGCGNATDILKNGMLVTVSCAEGDEGRIYDGLLEFEVKEVYGGMPPDIQVKFMLNVSNPQLAFDFSQLPNSGVGLARLEFIINNNIGIHPKAILEYPNLDEDVKKAVESAARGHISPYAFYVDKLSEGIATIAAAFYPKPVIVRMSDFKSNEYKKLIGGSLYEPDEENPMLGFRGTSRYISRDFSKAFEMECIALKRVRDKMGLLNIEIMVPFVRTVKQAKSVVDLLEKFGLKRGVNGLRLIMMCEVPTNAILAEEFLQFFDGFSIGSNDLTQLTLGLDRDSGMELLVSDFDERDPSVKFLIKRAIEICRRLGKYVGICGQGPSDHIDFAQWLVDEGIISISLNPDTIIDTWQALANISLSRRYKNS